MTEEMKTYAKSLRQSHEIMDIANFAKFERRMVEKKEIAHKLLQKGMVIDEILSITSLTHEQGKELLNGGS